MAEIKELRCRVHRDFYREVATAALAEDVSVPLFVKMAVMDRVSVLKKSVPLAHSKTQPRNAK